jgi:Catalytic LigB subunit of aromatic ring-opening dioxygenase
MAQLVYGFGSSHSPQLNMPAEAWHIRAQADRRIRDLIGVDGEVSGYEDLMNRRDDLSIIAKEITPEKFDKRHQENQAAINRISEALYRVDPDILVMVGDDQQEYLRDDNMPGMCVYWGDEVLVKAIPTVNGVEAIGDSQKDRTVPTHSALGRHLIEYLVEAEFDVGRSSFLEGGRADGGIGHAFSYVYHRLMTGKVIPTVPIMVNTYYPPNQPTPKRCYDFGRTLRSAIEAWPGKARVAILASGGLSHFVVDEDLDQQFMDGIKNKDIISLSQLPRRKLNSGNSEVRNWIIAAGAVEHLDLDYMTYIPCYRSEAGTGCAMAFAEWC